MCKYKNKGRQSQQAQVVDADPQEEQLFAASCFSSYDSCNTWLIDSGCTHHMCHNAAMFRDLDETYSSKVKIGNGEYVKVIGKGTIVVKTTSDIKLIPDMLCVLDISQNLLSVGSETRPLNPSTDGRNLTAAFRVIFKNSEVLHSASENEHMNESPYKPQRSSPGGPDPQHH
ncbi:hypothetical protein F0562_018337 [Nyssa sinensis]|uniref:Retrovirus-related Pol polyprotein from transposon TNT 1-94-like beta-barrel domain-containing protein n=1 Tax=Nyssa sinensis TaxID=561372 RepID=A0A5J4ZCA2_9ASTE|nr:hypothetical protein F0562_018337 [Nyssa sinensis]